MKIVCISASFVPSNTANSIQVMKVCQAMATLGHEVILLVPGDKRSAWGEMQVQYGLTQTFDIRWISENLAFKRYDFAFKAVQTAKHMAPDLIYTWVPQAAVLSLWQKLPTILEMHDRISGRLGPWLFRQFWKSGTKKRLLTITKALKGILISDFNLTNEQINQIIIAPDGVDLERYQLQLTPESARQQLNLQKGFTVGYTGHFYAGRGIELMFDLAKDLPEINFLWVGGDPVDVTIWKKRIVSSKITNITMTGFVDNSILPYYQAASDLLLMPYGPTITVSGGGNTAQIASPMKMFEYMASGRVIVTSDLPIIHEVLDKESAVFCPPDDLLVWKETIQSLQNDPQRRRQLGETARKYSRNYSWRTRTKRALDEFLMDSPSGEKK